MGKHFLFIAGRVRACGQKLQEASSPKTHDHIAPGPRRRPLSCIIFHSFDRSFDFPRFCVNITAGSSDSLSSHSFSAIYRFLGISIFFGRPRIYYRNTTLHQRCISLQWFIMLPGLGQGVCNSKRACSVWKPTTIVHHLAMEPHLLQFPEIGSAACRWAKTRRI
jgi:hypothetical protein